MTNFSRTSRLFTLLPPLARLRPAALLFAGFTLSSGAGAAEPQDVPNRDARYASTVARLAADGWMGMGWQSPGSEDETTFDLGTTLLYRPGVLTLGVGVELGGEFLGDEEYRVSALGGTTLALTSWLAVDALAEFGSHTKVMSSGWELFDETRVVAGDSSVTLPYAGVRLGPTAKIGKVGYPRFIIGPWLLARTDLGRTTANFTEESCGTSWLDGGYSCSTSEESRSLGGVQLAAGLRAGIEFGRR